MDQDSLVFSCSAFPDSAIPLRITAVETLGRPYRVSVKLSLPSDEELELDDIMGLSATASLPAGDGEPMCFSGIVTGVRFIGQSAAQSFVEVQLSPKLWLLSLTTRSYVFTGKKLPEIIEKTLQDGGLESGDYQLKLTGKYNAEAHVTQYKESNLQFLHRWLEREGIYYFFEHGDGGELLIITDSKDSHSSLRTSPVVYNPLAGEIQWEPAEVLKQVRWSKQVAPKKVKLKSYDFAKPSLDLSSEVEVEAGLCGEVRLHDDRFFDPNHGKHLAQMRAGALACGVQKLNGKGTARHLRAGYLFELTEHQNDAVNQEYLVVSAQHSFHTYQGDGSATSEDSEGQDVYQVLIEAIPSSAQYRQRCLTPWPRVAGIERATVDGESDSQYAQLDEHGSYLVKMGFDDSDLSNGKASTRIRLMQPHAGSIEGFHFPLRKGTEVAITFLDGDPDRPLIAGAVPNAHTPAPVTSANHTFNSIVTGSASHLEINDEAGADHMNWWTPFNNTELHFGNPKSWGTLGEDGVSVYAAIGISTDGTYACTLWGGYEMKLDVTGLVDEHVGGNVTERYGSLTTIIADKKTEIYKGTQDTLIQGTTVELIGVQDTNVATTLTEKLNGGQLTLAGSQTFDTSEETAHVSGASIMLSGLNMQKSAATTSNNAANVMLMGLQSWTSGSFTYGGTNDIWIVGAHFDSVLGNDGIVTPFRLELFGRTAEAITSKLEYVAVGIGLVAAKNEKTGVAAANNGLNIAMNLSEDESGGLENEFAGFHILV